MEPRTGASNVRDSSLDGGPTGDAWTPRARSAARDRDAAAARRGGRRGISAVLGALAVAAILVAVGSFGPVNTLLRQSFTRMDPPATQFYLNGSPWVSGEYLAVPLGLIEQNGASDGTVKVRLWTVDASGKTVSSGTVDFGYRNGRGTQNLSVLVPASAQIVWAQIVGTTLSVHYRFEGSGLPTGTTPSPSGKH